MAGEKAKENKTLKAHCAGCGKERSVELLRARVVGRGRERYSVPICPECLDAGWQPGDPPRAEG